LGPDKSDDGSEDATAVVADPSDDMPKKSPQTTLKTPKINDPAP